MPRPEEDKSEMKIVLEEDVKISFTFADYKLVVPWTVIYDSKKGVALKEIHLTFYHDDFDVHRVDYDTIFDTIVDNRLVRGELPVVSLVYNWEVKLRLFNSSPCSFSLCSMLINHWNNNSTFHRQQALQEDDLNVGVLTMFTLTLIATILMVSKSFWGGGSSSTRASSSATGGGTRSISSSSGQFISSSGPKGKRSN